MLTRDSDPRLLSRVLPPAAFVLGVWRRNCATCVAARDHGQARRSTAGSAKSAPRMNTVSGRTAGIQ